MQKIKADKEQQNLKRKESIQSLGVIGSDNQTSILSFGTDSKHVEMETGRTLEEEYFSIIEGMSQEYTSNGEPITINNGLKARLVGAEITGNTKRLDADGNECEAGTEGARLVSTEACISNNGIKYPFYQQYVEGETVVQKRAKGSSNEWVTIPQDEARDTVANEYRLYSPSGLGSVPSVEDTVDLASGVKTDNTKQIILNGSENWTSAGEGTNTIRFKILGNILNNNISDISTMCALLKVYSYSQRNLDTEMYFSINNGNYSEVNIKLLKSKLTTQDVNGFKAWLAQNPVTIRYQLATPIETQLTDEQLATYSPYKKQILLPFAEDKVTLNSDGSATWVNASKLIKACELPWRINSDVLNNVVQYSVSLYDIKSNLCMNCFSKGSFSVDGECFINAGVDFYIRIDKQFDTVEKFKLELERRNAVILYIKKEFNTITISKEVNAPVLTDKSNILSGGEAVAPSSFKVKVPVDVMAKINRLEALHI